MALQALPLTKMIPIQPDVAGSHIPSAMIDKERERKQRNREYRIAARREKRNRKADEKKQRKLNATILRRMTRNPDKYNKNAERNRFRAIELERRKIWSEALRQAQRLAAIYDPTGALFNVSPVVTTDEGEVITQEVFQRRQEKASKKAAAEKQAYAEYAGEAHELGMETSRTTHQDAPLLDAHLVLQDGMNPDRLTQIEGTKAHQHQSKNQQKKMAKFEPRPPPPKPRIPEDVPQFEGEEDWLSLWDLQDEELERRVIREKKRKAAARKALRVRQQSGKVERRMARDEKRKVYRDLKLEWRTIIEETTREKSRLKAIEDEESKKIAVSICDSERRMAIECCRALGFTLDNTPGVCDIKPRALGMRGTDVDFDAIERGERKSDIKPKVNLGRVDLSLIPHHAETEYVSNEQSSIQGWPDEFIRLNISKAQDFETLDFNHKLRRKLRRAIDRAEVEKEVLVRQRALEYYEQMGLVAPSILLTATRAVNVKGQRILESGFPETAKQERVRARMELAEFNTQMRVLRKQAKEAALYAGLYKYAEVTGRIPITE